MTPKQRVLKKAPDALACFTGGGYEIRTWGAKGYHGQIGFGHTHRAAWADAASCIHGPGDPRALLRRMEKEMRRVRGGSAT
jgi:hypothetical protein